MTIHAEIKSINIRNILYNHSSARNACNSSDMLACFLAPEPPSFPSGEAAPNGLNPLEGLLDRGEEALEPSSLTVHPGAAPEYPRYFHLDPSMCHSY